MRMLVFSDPDGPFIAGLQLPTARSLSNFQRELPLAYQTTFGEGEDNAPRKVAVADLVKISHDIRTLDRTSRRPRVAQHVRVDFCDGRPSRGPAGGLTGFTLDGHFCAASCEDKFVEISFYVGEESHSIRVFGDTYPVDNGTLIVKWSRGPDLVSFFDELLEAISAVEEDMSCVWLFVES